MIGAFVLSCVVLTVSADQSIPQCSACSAEDRCLGRTESQICWDAVDPLDNRKCSCCQECPAANGKGDIVVISQRECTVRVVGGLVAEVYREVIIGVLV